MPTRRAYRIVQIREQLGLSQADLAKKLWPGDHDSATLKLRTRTIQRWENEGVAPSPMAKAHLDRILDEAEHEHQKPQRKTAQVPASASASGLASETPSGVVPGVRI